MLNSLRCLLAIALLLLHTACASSDQVAAPAGQPPGGGQLTHAGYAQGTGTVNSVDAASRKINLSHYGVPALGLPAMSMDFAAAPSVDLKAVRPGTRVDFKIERGSDGTYVIRSIAPSSGG